MKFTNFQFRSVSLAVLVTFAAMLFFCSFPASAAPLNGNRETAVRHEDGSGPGFIETEGGSAGRVSKQIKFPWLIAGLGAVAIGVAVYFLVIKKSNASDNSVEGTYWGGTDSDNHYYIYRFYAGGKLGYTSPSGTYGTEGNTWVQTGNRIEMSINNGYSFRDGTITGDTMSGTAWNVADHHWTWTVTKIGSLTAADDEKFTTQNTTNGPIQDKDHGTAQR